MNHRSPNRRGYTLAEMTVVFALLSIVLALGGRTVVLFGLARSAQEESQVQALGEGRLARRFRGDVHAAQRATIPDDAAALVLSAFDGGTVRYEFEANLRRVVRRVEREGESPRVESYQVSPGESRFEVSDDGRFAAWRHVRPESRDSGSATSEEKLFVEAALARDARFGAPEAVPSAGEVTPEEGGTP